MLVSDSPIKPALPRFEMFDSEQCKAIHDASLKILRQTGFRVHQSDALGLLREAGADIKGDNLVRIPADLVDWALKEAPRAIGLCSRGSDHVSVPLESKSVTFGPGSDCLNYLDPRTGGRRPFAVRDLEDCIRVVDALPHMGFVMSMGIPHDLMGTGEDTSSENVKLYQNVYLHQFAAMIEQSAKPIVFVCNDRADCEAIAAMASAAAGGLAGLQRSPTILLYSEPSTPLQHSKTATEKLLYMAEQKLPVVHSPAPMMGGTAPVTLAGGLALGNAEILSSLVMHQLKNAGAPFVYGSGLHHMDMMTSISVYGAPEFQLARVGVAAMARFYGLPSWGYAGHSDSMVMDGQAASDATFSVMIALLTGTNLVHDVGYLEAGLTTSPEMIVFTDEVIDMMNVFMGGVRLDADELATEIVHRIGPGGNFLVDEHTIENFRRLWQPTLFERRRAEDWQADGAKTLRDRLREKTIALMEEHKPEPLPDRVKQEVERILKSAGGSSA